MATTTSVEFVKEVLTETEQVEAQPHERIVDDFLAGYVEIGAALKKSSGSAPVCGAIRGLHPGTLRDRKGHCPPQDQSCQRCLESQGGGDEHPRQRGPGLRTARPGTGGPNQDLEESLEDGREERSADHHRSDPEGAGEEDAAPSGESAGRVPH